MAPAEEDDDIKLLKDAVLKLTEQLTRQALMGAAANAVMPPAGPTLSELCEWWFSTEAFAKLQSGRDRRHNLEAHVLPLLGHHTQDSLSSDDVASALAQLGREKGLSAQTLNHCRNALSKVINDAAKRKPAKWTAANPVDGVERREVEEREPPMLTREQAAKLLQVVKETSPHWYPVFAVALFLGLRAGEIRGLHVEDVDLLHKRLNVRRSGRRETTKTGKVRKIPVPDELWPILVKARRERAGGAFLFGHGGHPLTQNWKSAQLCRAALQKAGLHSSVSWVCNWRKGCGAVFDEDPGQRCPECSRTIRRVTKPLEMDFHDLRHVSATLHQEAGCHLWVMVKVLGHAMPKAMTLRYTHLSEDKVRSELNRLSLLPDGLKGPDGGGTGGNVGPDIDLLVSEGDTQTMEYARSSDGQSIGLLSRCPPETGGLTAVAESPSPVAVAKFWSAVSRGAPTACWFWTGGTGHTRLFGRQELVRRVAYRLTRGPVGEKQAVISTCHEELCCNPAHLFTVPLGTPKASVGVANGRSKLTPAVVAEIRRAHAAGELSVKQLARINGVSPKAIRKVLRGETWRDQ